VEGGGGIAPPFLTSTLDGGEWSASRSCRFTSGERARSTHLIGGWVGPRVGLDAVKKRKIVISNSVASRLTCEMGVTPALLNLGS
jgi:hypothetical protein